MKIRELTQTGRRVVLLASVLTRLLTLAVLPAGCNYSHTDEVAAPISELGATSALVQTQDGPRPEGGAAAIDHTSAVHDQSSATYILQPLQAKCWAVVVGIGSYTYKDPLPVDKDAQDMVDHFAALWGKDHVKLLLNEEATMENIRSALVEWLRPKEARDDLVIFFFAGHAGGQGLVPFYASADAYHPPIDTNLLAYWLGGLNSRHIAVFLESCYSGKLVDSLQKLGRVVVTSSSHNESSWATSEGLFVRRLKEVFNDPAAVDLNGDNRVSVQEIHAYTADTVSSDANSLGKSQHPQMSDWHPGELELFGYANN